MTDIVGTTKTFDGWLAVDLTLASQSYSFYRFYGLAATQLMDRATLDGRIATMPVVATPPASATVLEGAAVVVHSLADANLAGSPGVAHVAAGALSKVNLTV